MRKLQGTIIGAEEKSATAEQYLTILLDNIPHKDFITLLGAKRVTIRAEK